MTASSGTPEKDDIARVAHAIWEAEGRPEGCDHEHWRRAKTLIEEGRAEIEYPESAAPGDDRAPRPVQPGFEDANPGMTPSMKAHPEPDPREETGGRFVKPLENLPEGVGDASEQVETAGTPGPRNPAPEPPTNAEGYVAIPSVDDAVGGAAGDEPQPPPAASETQTGRDSRPPAIKVQRKREPH